MRPLFAISFLLMIGTLVTSAQDNTNTPTIEDLQETASQLYIDQTSTADASEDEITPDGTPTPDEFALQATQLVQTATAGAIGNATVDPNPPTETLDSFELRATEIVMTATAEVLALTATAEANGETPVSQLDNNADGVAQPMNVTLLAVGLVVVVLVLIAGAFVYLSSRNDQNQ
ncbi:MAG: hypothetical protein AAF846_06225 [Chloroflexota bacterium]